MLNWILEKYWLFKCNRLSKAKGIVSWHITPAPDAKPWRVLREFFTHLQTPTTEGMRPYHHFAWEAWNCAEQDRLAEFYKNTYHLTDGEVGKLHMSFSPRKIPPYLTIAEVRKRVSEQYSSICSSRKQQ